AGKGVILLPLDTELMNNAFLDLLFRESFRLKIPVIGFSLSLAKRGAIVSLGLSPAALCKDLEKFAREILLDPNLPREKIFQDWELYLNQTVARKFGLTIPESILQSAMKVF
ncbi:MAG: hypothetical protein ACD_28C00366G0003, partial [uncultured bacterium]